MKSINYLNHSKNKKPSSNSQTPSTLILHFPLPPPSQYPPNPDYTTLSTNKSTPLQTQPPPPCAPFPPIASSTSPSAQSGLAPAARRLLPLLTGRLLAATAACFCGKMSARAKRRRGLIRFGRLLLSSGRSEGVRRLAVLGLPKNTMMGLYSSASARCHSAHSNYSSLCCLKKRENSSLY